MGIGIFMDTLIFLLSLQIQLMSLSLCVYVCQVLQNILEAETEYSRELQSLLGSYLRSLHPTDRFGYLYPFLFIIHHSRVLEAVTHMSISVEIPQFSVDIHILYTTSILYCTHTHIAIFIVYCMNYSHPFIIWSTVCRIHQYCTFTRFDLSDLFLAPFNNESSSQV